MYDNCGRPNTRVMLRFDRRTTLPVMARRWGASRSCSTTTSLPSYGKRGSVAGASTISPSTTTHFSMGVFFELPSSCVGWLRSYVPVQYASPRSSGVAVCGNSQRVDVLAEEDDDEDCAAARHEDIIDTNARIVAAHRAIMIDDGTAVVRDDWRQHHRQHRDHTFSMILDDDDDERRRANPRSESS